MARQTALTVKGNMATALGAKLCRPHVVPAYPITPSTLFPEKMSEYIADGELKANMIRVESEHSAMSACIGASATGARVCTASASQGIALMHEMLFIAAGMRLPIVMAVGNRALSAPINIWADHQDTMASRDCGWLQFFAERNQEGLDLMIMAFRVAEDERVLLPAMVGIDAFVLTHTMEGVQVPAQEDVDDFLPPYTPKHGVLDPAHPATFGSFGTPEVYQEFKYMQTRALEDSPAVIDQVFDDFERRFGRRYSRITPYRCEDADVVLLTMGSMTGTARAAVDELREQGEKAGLAKLTVFRPFPGDQLKEIAGHVPGLAVVDRNISPGFGGAVFAEAAGTFVNERQRPLIKNFITGLGGREIFKENIKDMYHRTKQAVEAGRVDQPVEWVNLNREVLP
ncbi:MAG: transketolase C-terminal domain-containing protein [Thermoplasmatota archaeon]